MPPEIPDELIDLLERLSEGSLDEAGRARLVEMLRADPRLRVTVAEHFAVSRALADLDRARPGFAARTAAHVAKVAGEAESTFARKVTRRIVRRRVAKVLAVAALLSLAMLPVLWNRAPATGPRVATLVRMDSENRTLSSTPLHTGSRIDEAAGLIRLDFENGAIVAIEAPARLEVVSGMEIALDAGRLNAWCPDTAHGFRVRTASAELTDLGTSFGVVASDAGDSEFVVLDGEVEIAKGDEKIRLAQGDALAAKGGDHLQSMAFDPSGYKNTWSLAHGILSTRGAVIPANPDIPEKLAAMESDDHVLVIPERRSVPFDFPLRAEITGPGTMPGDFDQNARTLPPQPEKRLSSFLIRYDPVGTFPIDYFIRFEGEVTFDRPVLAIVGRAEALEQSDPHFATGSWEAVFRGIELAQINNPPDSVTLSEDRRTVKVVFYAGASTDEIRVILED